MQHLERLSSEPMTVAASAATVFFGLYSHFFAVATGEEQGMSAGLILAFAGLITAVASVIVPALRIWTSERQHEREDRFKRHDLANKLQAALLSIEENKRRIEEQQTLIHNLSRLESMRSNRESGLGPY